MLHCLGSFTTGSGVDHPDLWHCFERLDRIHNGAAHKELVEFLVTFFAFPSNSAETNLWCYTSFPAAVNSVPVTNWDSTWIQIQNLPYQICPSSFSNNLVCGIALKDFFLGLLLGCFYFCSINSAAVLILLLFIFQIKFILKNVLDIWFWY